VLDGPHFPPHLSEHFWPTHAVTHFVSMSEQQEVGVGAGTGTGGGVGVIHLPVKVEQVNGPHWVLEGPHFPPHLSEHF